MLELLIFFALLISFYFLGKAADLVILNVREIGGGLGINVFFLGILLGFFTSIPELFLGVNAMINDIPEISVGNLLGGIIVLFGLVLGVSLILNRRIKTNGDSTEYFVIFAYIFSALFLGVDGILGFFDGLFLILAYLFLLYFIYLRRRNKYVLRIIISTKNETFKKCALIILGLILVIIISNLIIKLSLMLLVNFNVSLFLVGLLLFSFGTNLPELIVTVRSYHRKMEDLSLSNITGSAMANVFIIGVFSFIKPITINVNFSYYVLMLSIAVLFILFLIFYKTNKVLSRQEGIVLVLVYLLFLAIQIRFLIV